MGYWLLKTEPSEYDFGRLERERETAWTGINNPVALKHLRAAREKDELVIYHTGDERAAVGLAQVTRAAYPDSKNPKSVVIDVAACARFAQPVPLATLKANRAFGESPLVRQGRLSVVPLTAEQWKLICKWGDAK